ncbi:DUF924 family protein [Nioella nitratireducens]|uniref:DUF924 family protein n=1 Tax=Nioella nitratireducens TaxID=1287720 RepID=UPI0008FD8777|nr:DUF924 family protein [Nioella nitratireducens]
MQHPSEDILSFWLEEAGPDKWYGGGDAFDAEIRERFMDLWQEARDGKHDDWTSHPRKALALIILLDQFPRNMFRGEATAFSTDLKAHSAACYALKQGWDERFPQQERQFFYLPFMHSEGLTDQDHSMRLTCQKMPDIREDKLPHAWAHREIIRRYGRFPYRNAALGRDDSSAEREFLESGGYGKLLDEYRHEAMCK